MTRRAWFVLAAAVASVLQACLASSPAQAASPVLAGASKIELTPPVHTPLAGYSRRDGRLSQSVHDPVFVRALAVRDHNTTAVIVSCDLLIIDERLFAAVAQRVDAAWEGAPPTLLVAATHTHSGPGAYGTKFLEKVSMGHFDPQVFDWIADRIAEAILTASRDLQPATIRSATATTTGLVINRMEADGAVDAALTVVAFDRADRTPLAIVVNFAAHPTTLGAWNMALSADYPGVVTQQLEARFPSAVCLFVAGAVGDQAPVKHGDGFERAAWIGEELARQAAGLLEQPLPARAAESVVAEQRTIRLPPARLRWSRRALPSWVSARFVDDDATLTMIQVDSIAWLGVPCDLSAELGLELKRHAAHHGYQPVIAGFANDYIGYCLPARLYDTEHYEAMLAFNGPTTGELLVEELKRMIDTPAEAAHVEDHDGLPVIYLEGSPYEIGRQHGALLREDVRRSVGQILGYFRRYLKLPLIRTLAANWWLDRPWRQARSFIPADYVEELRGLSDGSGVPLKELWRLHAIPDRTYSCSGFAAWGRATADGRLIHTRNLDWNIHADIQRYATVFVVRPEGKQAFVNVGWAGFIGVLTGINEQGISIGQVGAETTDATFRGLPMTFLMRRVLEEAGDVPEAVAVIEQAPRTVGVNYLIADANTPNAVAVETTHRHVAVFDADDPDEHLVTYARPIPDVVFRADTAVNPQIRDRQMASKGDPRKKGLEPPGGSAYEVRYLGQAAGILAHYGQITPEIAKQIAQTVAPGSNVQSVVFAWPDLWVANADGSTRATHTPYRHLNLEELLAPSLTTDN